MIPKELEEIKARHVPTPSGLVCDWDTEPWPCEAARLVVEAERLRGVVEERDRQIERMALRYGMRQEAALEGKDG